MKTETKAELRERIAVLEEIVRMLSDQLEQEERAAWEKKMPIASVKAYNTLSKIFPRMIYDLTFVHVDKAGYWYTFQLVNDERRQTYCVRHEDLVE